MPPGDASPVGGIELEGRIVRFQEGGEPGADRARAEQGDLGDSALAEPLVPLRQEAELIVGALEIGVVRQRDDRRGDRQSAR